MGATSLVKVGAGGAAKTPDGARAMTATAKPATRLIDPAFQPVIISQTDGQTRGPTDGQTDSQTDSQTHGQTDGQTRGQTDGQTSGQAVYTVLPVGNCGLHFRAAVAGFGPGQEQLIASTGEARIAAGPLGADAGDGLPRAARAGPINPADAELRALIGELDPRRDR